MKKLVAVLAVVALGASPALAHTKHHAKSKAHKMHAMHSGHRGNTAGRVGLDDAGIATVTERDSRGRATKVSVEGREYVVCAGTVVDACINPRAAGLNFGNVPLDHWPGKPASEM